MVAVFFAPLLTSRAAIANEGVLIAAAADLQPVIEPLGELVQSQAGVKVRWSLGSTGNLRRQIQQGAPFEIFMAADESHVARLVEAGATRGLPFIYALGRLSLVRRCGLEGPWSTEAFVADVRSGKLARVAIANPEHAPYGLRGREVLRSLGLEALSAKKLIMGENIAQTAQLVLTGSVDAALLSHSLVQGSSDLSKCSHVSVPETLHSPLRQAAVLTARATGSAQRVLDVLKSTEARAIFVRFGFQVPEAGGR